MRARRRSVEVFSLSFLDCICCGFGALILLLVVTQFQRPVQLEASRRNLQQQVRALRVQLQTIRGDSADLQRQLQGRIELHEHARHELARLAGELSAIRGQNAGSIKDAAATNAEEAELVATQQTLTKEMQRILAQSARRAATAPVAGIPIDSDYLIFVIDTSSSMTFGHWDANLAVIDEVLTLYPHIAGLQVLNDQGLYLFGDTRGQWLTDSPAQRAEIRARAQRWHAFSQSNPVPGIEEAIRSYWNPDRRVSLFVLGDEFTGRSIQAALDSIGRLNRPDGNGRRPIRIHAIGFPESAGMSAFTNIRFSALMRLVCEQNNGTFMGMRQ